ncbi:MAG: amino acid hydroxylase [Gemmatimonadota bacterium]|nr:amino acid hydroxylase [Gemmatimonadota bacterium]
MSVSELTMFTDEQHAVWRALFARQLPRVRRLACSAYLEGWDLLALPADRIPRLAELNERITPRTGWRTVRTSVRYTDAVPWYRRFARREFLVTDYMRSRDELEFTPEPDMFHDIFGHLPFMTLPRYAALEEMFAPAFLRASDEQREHIKRLAWYSTEFGIIREGGELRAFGAGLLSSIAELESAMSGAVPIVPFTIESVIGYEKAVWSHNEVLFVFDSIEALMTELDRYFAGIRGARHERALAG